MTVGDIHGPLFFRDLPPDLSDGRDREEYMRRLAAEVERSNFFARQGERSAQVKQIRLAGDPALVAALLLELEKDKGLDVAHWRPEKRFAYQGEAAPWDMLLPLAGAAVCRGSRLFNLIQRSESQQPSRRLRAHAMLAGGTAMLAILPLLGGGGYMTRGIQGEAIESQQQLLLQSRRAAETAARDYLRLRSLLAKQRHMAAIGNPPGNLGEILRDLAERIPPQVRLTGLALTKDATGEYRLVLAGESRGASSDRAQAEFLTFQAALAQSLFLAVDEESPFLKIAEDGDRKGAAKVSFSLEYRLRGSGRG